MEKLARNYVRYFKAFLLTFNNAALRQFIIDEKSVRIEIQSFGACLENVLTELNKYNQTGLTQKNFLNVKKSYNSTLLVEIKLEDIKLDNLGQFYADLRNSLKLVKRVKTNFEIN